MTHEQIEEAIKHNFLKILAVIEEAIAEITAQLKGPMSNIERALLVADRKELREELSRQLAELEPRR